MANKWHKSGTKTIQKVARKSLCRQSVFRQRYRPALTEVVATIIRSDEAATDASVRAKALATVADKNHFIGLALAEFNTLHTGNAVRFGIGPLEFAAWQEKHAKRNEPT